MIKEEGRKCSMLNNQCSIYNGKMGMVNREESIIKKPPL